METLACLIVDDPLIRPKYGNLSYEILLKEMKAHNFFTEIAFIPWNYKRSDPRTINLFRNNPDYFAICVHGCNHTKGEFGGIEYNQLQMLAETALWRMEQHKKLTDLNYDPVMVFPQGKFSTIAMEALKNVGYFAAFNSSVDATDRKHMIGLPVTMVNDFPLFLRRYPKDKNLWLEDIKLGRPILITTHPNDFNDIESLTSTVDWINSQGNIRWTSLLNIAEYYLRKKSKPIGKIKAHMEFNFKVTIRRYLSEVRDNYPLISKLQKVLRG